MKRVCYICSVLLAFAWILSVFLFHIGAAAHIFILLAVISLLHGVITISQKKYMLDEKKVA